MNRQESTIVFSAMTIVALVALFASGPIIVNRSDYGTAAGGGTITTGIITTGDTINTGDTKVQPVFDFYECKVTQQTHFVRTRGSSIFVF